MSRAIRPSIVSTTTLGPSRTSKPTVNDQPANNVLVTNDQRRSPRVHVRDSPFGPARKGGRSVRRHRAGGFGPPRDQLALKFAVILCQYPVAGVSFDVIAGGGEVFGGRVSSVWPQRRAEAFVDFLMRIHQPPNLIVLRV